MKFSTLFRLKENLSLDKNTLVNLRWIAIIGQLSTINIVYFYLNLEFSILYAHLIIFFGLASNVFLQFRIKAIQLKIFMHHCF